MELGQSPVGSRVQLTPYCTDQHHPRCAHAPRVYLSAGRPQAGVVGGLDPFPSTDGALKHGLVNKNSGLTFKVRWSKTVFLTVVKQTLRQPRHCIKDF